MRVDIYQCKETVLCRPAGKIWVVCGREFAPRDEEIEAWREWLQSKPKLHLFKGKIRKSSNGDY